MMFKKTDDPKLAQRLNRLKRVFPSHSRERFARCVKEFKPDAVLCTHYLPLELLGDLRRKAMRRPGSPAAGRSAADCSPGPLVVSIVTDFEAQDRKSVG